MLHLVGSIASRIFRDGSSFLPDYNHSDVEEEEENEERGSASSRDNQHLDTATADDCETTE